MVVLSATLSSLFSKGKPRTTFRPTGRSITFLNAVKAYVLKDGNFDQPLMSLFISLFAPVQPALIRYTLYDLYWMMLIARMGAPSSSLIGHHFPTTRSFRAKWLPDDDTLAGYLRSKCGRRLLRAGDFSLGRSQSSSQPLLQ